MKTLFFIISMLLLFVCSSMAASVSDLSEDTSPANNDFVMTLDVSDITMATSGTNKKVAIGNLASIIKAYVLPSGSSAYATFSVISSAGITLFQVDDSGVSMLVVEINDINSESGTSNDVLVRASTGIKWESGDSARTALGLAIGTNVQAYNDDLDSLSGVGNDKIFYSDGTGGITELAIGASGLYLVSQGAGSAPTWSTASVETGGSGATFFGTDDLNAATVGSGGTVWIVGADIIETSASGNSVFVEIRADGGATKYFMYSAVTATGGMLAGGILYWDSIDEGGVSLEAISSNTPYFVFKDIGGGGVSIYVEEDDVLYGSTWGTILWVPPDNIGHQIALTANTTGTSTFWDVIGRIGDNWNID